MDAEIKQKWLKALRSGRYQQADGTLRDDGKFCCLGVLCQVIDRHGWRKHGGHRGAISFPGPGVLRKAAVSDDSGDENHPFWPLAHMNDEGKSFAEIADHIERNL